jgi:3-methyladenine DNA glycosylase AlkD
MNRILKELRADLLSLCDEKTRIAGERYFREDVKIYGIKSSEVGIVSKEYYKKIDDKSKKNVFTLCEDLWKSGMMEESFIACNWSYNVRKEFTRDDFVIFEEWVNKYVNNWASCDTFCNHTVGAFIDMYPEFLEGLKKWAKSENRWVKRASAVSLIIPGKKGRYLKDIFQIADILHSDKDDMVQKGYGWMLKVASQAHQQEVFEYVLSKKSTMPRTALRYAIEKMPADLKAEAMKK